MFYDTMRVEHELIISVGINTFKMKDSLVITRKEYLRTLGHNWLIIRVVFSL